MDLIFKKNILEFQEKNGYFPVNFSIPKCKVLDPIKKTKDFSRIMPGIMSTYVFKNEADYMKDYSISKFGITIKKGGWDCMRHLEIMAANCLPIFADLCYCPPNCLYFYPKDIFLYILENLNEITNDENIYNIVSNKIRNHLEKYLTCESMILNIFNIIGIDPKKILFIDSELSNCPDYLSIMILIGLKNNFGKNCEVIYSVNYLYKSCPIPNEKMHGFGFNYAKVLDDEIKSENEVDFDIQKIERKIINKEYDLIVFGSLTRSSFYLDYIINNYPKEKIIGFIGEDYHQNNIIDPINGIKDKLNLFVREVY